MDFKGWNELRCKRVISKSYHHIIYKETQQFYWDKRNDSFLEYINQVDFIHQKVLVVGDVTGLCCLWIQSKGGEVYTFKNNFLLEQLTIDEPSLTSYDCIVLINGNLNTVSSYINDSTKVLIGVQKVSWEVEKFLTTKSSPPLFPPEYKCIQVTPYSKDKQIIFKVEKLKKSWLEK
jgi:hypothetical protein